MTDHDLDRILTTLKSDDGTHLGSVAPRVMAQIDFESSRRRRRNWFVLAAAAALLIAVRFPAPQAIEPLPSIATAPNAPEIAFARCFVERNPDGRFIESAQV